MNCKLPWNRKQLVIRSHQTTWQLLTICSCHQCL